MALNDENAEQHEPPAEIGRGDNVAIVEPIQLRRESNPGSDFFEEQIAEAVDPSESQDNEHEVTSSDTGIERLVPNETVDSIQQTFQRIEEQKAIVRDQITGIRTSHEGRPATFDTQVLVDDALEGLRVQTLSLNLIGDIDSIDELIVTGSGVKEHASGEYHRVHDEIIQNSNNLNTLKEQLSGLEKRKGLGKLVASFQIPGKQKQLQEIQSKLKALREESDTMYSQEKKAEQYVAEALKHKERLINTEIANKLAPIEDSYAELIQRVANDDTVLQEVKLGYVSHYLKKYVKALPLDCEDEGEKADESIKKDFIEKVQAYVKQPDSNNGEYPEEIQASPVVAYYDRDVTEGLAEVIKAPNLKSTVRNFLENVAFKEITEFKKGLTGEGNDFAFGANNYVGTRHFFNNFDVSSARVQMWQAIKVSPGLQAAFGDRIQETESRIFDEITTGAMGDTQGFIIDCLEHYPTPDTIQTAVLIAAADRSGYRISHANRVLRQWAQDPDFPEKLDEAIKKYPELEPAREKLLSWTHYSDSNEKEITALVEPLAAKIVDENTADYRLVRIAEETLPTQALLERLVAQKKLDPQMVTTLTTVGTILTHAQEKNPLPYIDVSRFKEKVRSLTLGAFTAVPDLELFGRMEQLSKLLTLQQSNPESLAFLTQKIVLDSISIREPLENLENLEVVYRTVARTFPVEFIRQADRAKWKAVLGERIVNDLLTALPKASDEKRNAFTHNQYDRTSFFIETMLSESNGDFGLNQKDFEIMTKYIAEYGLARIPGLFHYYKHISLKNQDDKYRLPKDIEESGITSTNELQEQLNRVRGIAYSEDPMLDISKLTSFEKEILKYITGKSTHRHDTGRPPFEQIVNDFERNMSESRIEPLPVEYKTENIEIPKIRIEFDPTAVRPHYEILKEEILESLSSGTNVDGLVRDMGKAFEKKTQDIQATIQQAIEKQEDKKRDFASRELLRYQTYITELNDCKNIDQFVQKILSFKIDKNEQPIVNSLLRRCTFQSIFNTSSAYRGELQPLLAAEISPEAIKKIADTIKDPIQEHMLNLKSADLSNYWSEETIAILKANHKRLGDIFSPHMNELREAVQQFEIKETGDKDAISAIPDRGFIGEMSGYLADVCYTKEYPLLAREDLIVPYKFVTTDKETGEPKFVGSVLVFEIEGENGVPAMMVRAFDVPNETEYNIPEFIEQFLDRLAVVAKQRGKEEIYIPGLGGAISNYQITIEHMRQNYIQDKPTVRLAKDFRFNDYDLTNNSYVARRIEK